MEAVFRIVQDLPAWKALKERIILRKLRREWLVESQQRTQTLFGETEVADLGPRCANVREVCQRHLRWSYSTPVDAELAELGKAAVYRREPLTIILKDRVGGETQPITLKIDPGSKTTGMALVGHFQRGPRVVWAAEIHHRGPVIHQKMVARRQVRRGRRHRKTRYRPPSLRQPPATRSWVSRNRIDRIHQWQHLQWMRQHTLRSQEDTQVPDGALSIAQKPGDPQPTDTALSVAHSEEEEPSRLVEGTEENTEDRVSVKK